MSDYSELKRLAEAAKTEEVRVIQLCADGRGWEALPAQSSFRCLASPEAVLALIADLQRNESMLLAACMDMGAIGNALGADMNSDGEELLSMVFELKAEVAGLKTGYEAYERVNAELKAKCEALHKDANRFRRMRAMTLAQIEDTQDEFDAEFDRQLDAAMGNGEQS